MSDIPGLLGAALADRYAIQRELGQGGMATVYLAEDLKHHGSLLGGAVTASVPAWLGAFRAKALLAVAFALAAGPARAQDSAAVARAIDSILAASYAANGPGAAVLVALGGRVGATSHGPFLCY